MATIRVTCPDCGAIELPSERIELVTVPGRPIDRDNTYYTFACDRCGTIVRRAADRIAAHILTSAGVAVRPPHHPVFRDERPPHPEAPPDGPPLTLDDVLELHLLLDGEHWFEQLLAAGRGPGR